jgi:DNA-binding MarR family transcriptional regulator
MTKALRAAISVKSVPKKPQLKLEEYLPYRLSVATNTVSKLIARAYEDKFGITIPQWRLIAVLGELGTATQQCIVNRTVTDKVTVGRAAQGLLVRRLIRRTPHEVDGRSHHLMLTETGARLYKEIAPLALRYERELLAELDLGEIEGLKAALRHLEIAARKLSNGEPSS